MWRGASRGGLVGSGGGGRVALGAAPARRRGEQRFRALVQASSDVITVLDGEGRQTCVSPSAQSLMGYTMNDLVTMPHRDLLHPDDFAVGQEIFTQVIADDDREYRTEMRVKHADGTWHWHELAVRNLLHDPAVRGIVVNHRDITERREFQDRLAYDAAHDPLTGLANRATFLDELGTALARAPDHGHSVAVVFVDLNDFKRINDTWGHEVGDALLVAFGRMLERSVLGADTVARLGGDEFGIVLAVIDSPGAARAIDSGSRSITYSSCPPSSRLARTTRNR